MIENHPSIEIEKFAKDVKSALQGNADVELFPSVGTIGDLSTVSKAVVNVSVVSIYIDETSFRSQADHATITEAVYSALAEHPKCKDVFTLGNYTVAVFDTPFKSDIDEVLDSVGKVNTLVKLVNKIYPSSSQLVVYIGMNYGKALLLKSIGGDEPHYVWSGDAVSTAIRLSSPNEERKKETEDTYVNKVYASFTIFNNLKEDYKKLFTKVSSKDYYEATPVNIAMNKWINANV